MSKLLARLPDRSLAWPIAWPAVALIAQSEGCALQAYKCPAGVWTIGFGHTDNVFEGETWTAAFADATFCRELTVYAAKVRALCKVQPNGNELGALVSLSYNIGLAALAKSAVLAAHNRGDKPAAAQCFNAYNKARVNGKLTVLAGLARRRAQEAALYLTPETDAAPVAVTVPTTVAVPDFPAPAETPTAEVEPLPRATPSVQDVAPPQSLVTHPLSLTGAAAAATGAVNAVQSVTYQVQTVATTAQAAATTTKATATAAHDLLHTAAAFLGVEPWMLVSAALVAAGAGLIFWLRAQRRAGKL